MNVSSINMATSTYAVAAQNAQSTNSIQSGNTTQSTQADSVNLSTEALKQSRLEQYPLKTDPAKIFYEWKQNDGIYANLGPATKSYEELLPENQELITQLKAQMKSQTIEERRQTEADIATVSMFGDNEIFSNRQEISQRLETESIASRLKYAFVEKKYGEIPLPDGLEAHKDSQKSSIPMLSELTNYKEENTSAYFWNNEGAKQSFLEHWLGDESKWLN
ncbi:MAG: hypothetical protein CO158_04780 [Piscirickettsiaceae bacterium CG_4_9_14_3_um_filter_43_564]|nr:hypothetical protein [Thiomicrospira sp.]NCN67367.1 hypothetical protein [Thiomicrospira sp.]NCO13607.1 hypothetical protein [Thiomicrospira sp.]PJA66166.1 MAG: hypothetical protein CO158_04780 [Piscirickettsiaceae bacterium CG_4_9_14_3_um_filter_43_564]